LSIGGMGEYVQQINKQALSANRKETSINCNGAYIMMQEEIM